MTTAGIIQRWRRWKLARRGLRVNRSCYVGRGVSLGPDHTFAMRGRVEVANSCELNQGVELSPFGGSIRLARRVWLGPYVVIYGHGGVEIGEETLVSMHCTILSSNHGVPPLGKLIRDTADELLPTKIGRDVWIGANAVILGGVTIGEGAVVAAGAVVNRDVEAGAVVAGVPAREIRKRVNA
jgi:acetyltransferase-like isoleucine patch superfamily enzyme